MVTKKSVLCLFVFLISFCSLAGLCFSACPEYPIGPTIPKDVNYPPSWLFMWSPDNPQEIAPANPSVQVSVINGQPPYSWELVSGNGFQLGESNTANNTLSVDGTACGAASITVIDGGGKITIGSVRSMNGHWVKIEIANADGTVKACPAGLNYPWDELDRVGFWEFVKTKGKYQVWERLGYYLQYGGGSYCDGTSIVSQGNNWVAECTDLCDVYDVFDGCNPCIATGSAGRCEDLTDWGYHHTAGASINNPRFPCCAWSEGLNPIHACEQVSARWLLERQCQ